MATLVDETKAAGYYTVRFDATGLASGMYIYRTKARLSSPSVGEQAGDFVETKKLLLLR